MEAAQTSDQYAAKTAASSEMYQRTICFNDDIATELAILQARPVSNLDPLRQHAVLQPHILPDDYALHSDDSCQFAALANHAALANDASLDPNLLAQIVVHACRNE